jgi:signal transduction histidine kinase/ligand-binding sensor domain-containing protein
MRICCIILFLFLLLKTEAQTSFAFNHITTEDGIGLNSDIVHATYQDEKGFLWIGTSNGLQRFDGTKFISFASGNSDGQLPVSDLVKIIPGKKSELWLHFKNRREVGIFNTSTFQYKIIPEKSSGDIPARQERRLLKDSKGAIYLSIWRYGILKYSEELNAFIDFNGFQLPKGWVPTAYLFEDTVTQRMWLPCADSGLAMYDRKSNKTYTQKNNSINHPILQLQKKYPGATEFFIDSKRRYWVFSWDTAHHFRCFSENGMLLKDTAGLSENDGYQELRYFFESKRKGLWLYGLNALYHLDTNASRFSFTKGSNRHVYLIQYSAVHEITEDRDGGIWIATDNGLYFITSGRNDWDVRNYSFRGIGDSNYEFTDILQLRSGEYWISSWGNGVLTLTDSMQKYDAGIYKKMSVLSPARTSQYKQTWALYQQNENTVWIGCQAGLYMLYNPVTKVTTYHELKEAENATLRFIEGDAAGNIWIGTQRGHVIKYDGKSFAVVQKFNTIIRKVFVDKQGDVWVVLEGDGLYRLDKTGQQIIRHYSSDSEADKLFQNIAYDIEQLNDSIIICAAGAMNFINKKTGKVHWITAADGLPGNSLMRVRKDHLGYIWMITANGLCRFNPANNRITPYGRKDGVTIAKTTKESDYISADDLVMFAGGPDLLIIKTQLLDTAVTPPDVLITDFKLFDQFLPVDSLLEKSYIKLNYNQSSFTINFSSLSYLQREKLVYYYRMRGITNEWQRTEQLGTVSFTLLPPGKYTFEVYCENIDGIRSKNIASVQFHILPPFWRTAWFLSTLLTIIAFIAYAMHRLRIKRLLAVEKIRNRVARDLHDDMGSTLSTINILSSMAKAKLNNDVQKTGEYINKISDNSQRMMEAMDDIVWAIKPANDSMQKVVGRMREFATNVFEAKDIDLEFIADEAVNNVNIDMEARRDFFLIFKEAVNNAAKYSKCSKAVVHVSVEGKKLMLQVKDNGVGFDVKAADSGNGLGNMQKRADALKGKLEMNSKAGEGTIIKLAVPLN